MGCSCSTVAEDYLYCVSQWTFGSQSSQTHTQSGRRLEYIRVLGWGGGVTPDVLGVCVCDPLITRPVQPERCWATANQPFFSTKKEEIYIENQNNGTCDEAWPEKKKKRMRGVFLPFFYISPAPRSIRMKKKRCVYYVVCVPTWEIHNKEKKKERKKKGCHPTSRR